MLAYNVRTAVTIIAVRISYYLPIHGILALVSLIYLSNRMTEKSPKWVRFTAISLGTIIGFILFLVGTLLFWVMII